MSTPDHELAATIRIDRSKFVDRHRYVCPNGHSSFYPTNSHLWCKTCRQQYENGHDDVEAEHYEVLDKKTGQTIPWSAVELVE